MRLVAGQKTTLCMIHCIMDLMSGSICLFIVTLKPDASNVRKGRSVESSAS
jgi:hypothetical protein